MYDEVHGAANTISAHVPAPDGVDIGTDKFRSS